MNQPHLKLTYFDLPIRAELTRLAFSYAGLKFEDDRVSFDQWPDRKPKTPMGKMPILEVDGTPYTQSMAIARYSGRLSGLYPADPLDALKVDSLLETMVEALNKYVDIHFDENNQQEKTKEAVSEFFPKIFDYVEKRVQGKFVLGDKISLADLYVFDIVTNAMRPQFPEFSFAAYPRVQGIVDEVKTIPRIAAYLASLG